jgi:hypothetical protein
MAQLLMISPRFADHRIWADIPARMPGNSEITYYEQRGQAGDASAGLQIRELVPVSTGSFGTVVAAEDAARLAVGVALDGLADGVVLLQPSLDGIPEELGPTDFSGLEERAALFAPLLKGAGESDPAKWRALVEDVVNQAIGVRLGAADAALVREVMGDHAGEIQGELQRALAAHARGEQWQTAADPGQRWIDRIRELSVPVVIISNRSGYPAAEVLAARAPHGRAVLARGDAGIPWLEDRDATVGVLTGMIG